MTETKIINAVIESIIAVLGESNWNSMTVDQQHDAIMIVIKDFGKALDRI